MLPDERQRRTDASGKRIPWHTELRNAVLGNAAYDFVKSFVLPRLVPFGVLTALTSLVALATRELAAAMPRVQATISAGIAVVIVTVGHVIIAVITLLLFLGVWVMFGRQRWLGAQRRQQSGMTFRAVYHDRAYATGWIANPGVVATYFAHRGFEELNAGQLARWVDARMRRGEASRSLVVFAQDMMPDTVADLRSATCKLRLFLESGGRVVWHGDVPFWHQARCGGRYDTWGEDGALLVLGVQTISMEEFFGNRVLGGMLTAEGLAWGIRLAGPAHRPVPRQQVDDAFTVGPPLKLQRHTLGQLDTACCWRKVYNGAFPHSGFLRYWPFSRDGQDDMANADYFRFATLGWSAAAGIEAFEVSAPQTQVIVSGAACGVFRAPPDESWSPATLVSTDWRWIRIPNAQWIWWRPQVTPEFQRGGTVEYTRQFWLEGEPRQATLMLAVDDRARNLRVNGVALGFGQDVGDWDRVMIADLTPHVLKGRNVLEMAVVDAPPDAPPGASPDNPTGLCYRIDVVY